MIHSERWSDGLCGEVLRHLEDQTSADHPQTKRFYFPQGENGVEFYLKMYRRSRVWRSLKDFFRDSKAFRALKMGEALSDVEFHVPVTVAAGEERSFRLLKRAFLLTLGVEAFSLPAYLRQYGSLPLAVGLLRKKRKYLKQLALEIRRLHQCGFVHGDLVPSNILVRPEDGGIAFYYIDNDRTRRYRLWLPNILWKRNLIQLNRFVLHGISLQDRMRFLRFYLGQKSWGKRERRLIRWLEKKTRKRRRECDRIEAIVTFRELMRWNGPFARNSG